MSSNTKNHGISDPPLDSLAFFGISWYKRGVTYWLRRGIVGFLFVFISAIVFAMAAGITSGIIDSGASPPIAIPIAIAIGAASTAWHGRKILRYQRERAQVDTSDLTPEKPKKRPRGAQSGATGFLLSGLGGLGAIVVVVSMPFAIGVFPWLLFLYLKPLAPGELRARRKVAKWLERQGRQHEIPRGWAAP